MENAVFRVYGAPGSVLHRWEGWRSRLRVGDNPDRICSEGALAKLCGAYPIPASSGKVTRYRLNRGGNLQANAALHRVVAARMRGYQPTIDYVRRRTAEGKSKTEYSLPQALRGAGNLRPFVPPNLKTAPSDQNRRLTYIGSMPRKFLRLATYINQNVSLARRRVIHVQCVAALRDLISVA